MDKIDRKKKEYRHHSNGTNAVINDMVDKLDELVEGYNEIMEWREENLESYIKVLKGLADLDNRLEKDINEVRNILDEHIQNHVKDMIDDNNI